MLRHLRGTRSLAWRRSCWCGWCPRGPSQGCRGTSPGRWEDKNLVRLCRIALCSKFLPWNYLEHWKIGSALSRIKLDWFSAVPNSIKASLALSQTIKVKYLNCYGTKLRFYGIHIIVTLRSSPQTGWAPGRQGGPLRIAPRPGPTLLSPPWVCCPWTVVK